MLTTNNKKYQRLPLVPSTALGRLQSQKLSILALLKASQQSPLPHAISVGLGSARAIPSCLSAKGQFDFLNNRGSWAKEN